VPHIPRDSGSIVVGLSDGSVSGISFDSSPANAAEHDFMSRIVPKGENFEENALIISNLRVNRRRDTIVTDVSEGYRAGKHAHIGPGLHGEGIKREGPARLTGPATAGRIGGWVKR